jgi:hypothetical protein
MQPEILIFAEISQFLEWINDACVDCSGAAHNTKRAAAFFSISHNRSSQGMQIHFVLLSDRDETTQHKSEPDLNPCQPRIDVGIFDHPQLIMHHSLMASFIIRSEVIDNMLQKRAGKSLVLVNAHKFRSFLFWLMLNLIAFCCDAPSKNLFGSPCGKIASKDN